LSTAAITVENLSKQFQLGAAEGRGYRTFREALVDAASAPLRRLKQLRGSDQGVPTHWALNGVNFAVEPGEVVGIIGRNGAGKSTLLKVLSRITEPTKGRVRIRGRVASLLEVGTGFHPELSGRENIFLNGAILGMSRREITAKFDEIVSFAEVEKFIDTPVKRYSSGMYLRLAFAVAAHLEPEILVVDEVLAVGDAGFQKKCLNKMEDVGHQGRTVLFVSHSMPAITRLCPRTILLDQGRVLRDGPSHEVVSVYLSSGLGTQAAREWADPAAAPGNDVVRLRAARVLNHEGEVSEALDIRRPVFIESEYEVLEPGRTLSMHCAVRNDEGVLAFVSIEHDPKWHGRPRPAGRYRSRAVIPGNFLAEGTHVIGLGVCTHQPFDAHFFAEDAVAFQTIDSMEGDSARLDYGGRCHGVVRPLLEWNTELVGA
jgi:lipopolysaccharide transport system ATP-binding protein